LIPQLLDNVVETFTVSGTFMQHLSAPAQMLLMPKDFALCHVQGNLKALLQVYGCVHG
jgi:hypothetical protein